MFALCLVNGVLLFPFVLFDYLSTMSGLGIGMREKVVVFLKSVSFLQQCLIFTTVHLQYTYGTLYERLHKLSKKPVAHHELHYMLEHSDYSRVVICEKIGISRKTIYDWEYQLVRVKPSMLDKVAKASGIPLDRIPAHVRDKAVKAFIETYHTKTEQKPASKPKDEPPTHKRDVYGENVKAEAERKAKQAAKATDPKRHRIPNFGYPTAANKNPSTFSQLGPRSLALIKQEGGRDIPSDAELPDMIAVTLEPLKCYEPVFVGHHMIPHVGNRTGTINAGGDIYWKRPGGTRCVRATLDEAKAVIAQQMAQDEAATADLI